MRLYATQANHPRLPTRALVGLGVEAGAYAGDPAATTVLTIPD